MAYDGSIRINTKIDGKGFDTGIKRMMSSLGSLAASLGIVFGVAGMVNFGKKSVETAMQMEAGWQGLRYMANAYGKDLGHIKEFLNEFTEDGLVPMMNAQQAYKNMLARGYNTDQLEKMLLIMKDSAVYLRKGQLAIGDAIEKTTMGLRTERSILTDSSGIEKNMYKMWQAYAKEMGTTISALTQEQKLIAEFQGFMEEGAVYAGAAAEYTETYAGKVAQLTAAMVGLKVSVGNMIIPLLNAILPKIIAMVKWFTYWFNIIGRVLNLLFGTQVGASSMDGVADDTYEAADAQDELANATGRAGKAAKGALASFDKLNVLAKPEAPSGGGGDVGVDISLPEDDTEGIFGKMGKAIDEVELKLAAFKQNLLAFFEPLREPFNRLKEAFLTLGATIGTGLGWAWENILKPFFTWISQSLSPVALDLVTAALDLLNEILIAVSPLLTWLWENILQPLGNWAADALITALGWIIEKLGALADWVSEHQETVQTLVTILLAIKGAFILVSAALGIMNIVMGVSGILASAFGAAIAFLTSPIGLVILAIAALIAIGVLLWRNWDKIKEWGIKAWEGIKEAWSKASDNFKNNVVEPIKKSFSEGWADIKERASTAWTNIKTAWQNAGTWFDTSVVQPIKGFFDTAWTDITGFFTTAWTNIETAWQNASTWFDTNVITPVKNAFDTAFQAIKGFMESPFEGLESFVKGVFNGIIAFINGLLAGITSGVNNLIGLINGLSIKPPKWAQDLFGIGDSIGFNIPTVSAPQIPLLATGAVIPPNSPFAAILGDQRSGTNVEAPLSTIEKAVDNVLARRGVNAGSDNGLIHNVIKLDGQVLYDAFKKVDKRVGRSMVAGSGIR